VKVEVDIIRFIIFRVIIVNRFKSRRRGVIIKVKVIVVIIIKELVKVKVI